MHAEDRVPLLARMMSGRVSGALDVSGVGATGGALLETLRRRYAETQADALALLAVGDAPRYEKLAPAQHAAWTQLCATVLASDVGAMADVVHDGIEGLHFRTGDAAHLAERLDVPVQHFVSRADLACGTTIGPITAAAVGVRTLDVGVAQLAMHSVRELAGRRDGHDLYRVLREYLTGDGA